MAPDQPQSAAMLDHCLTRSYEQYVIDNEICGMVARVLSGIQFGEEAFALDVIDRVGPGGNFLADPHTMAHLREEQFLPELADRDERTIWEARGSRTVLDKARVRTREILEQHKPAPLAEDVDRELRRVVELAEAKAGT